VSREQLRKLFGLNTLLTGLRRISDFEAESMLYDLDRLQPETDKESISKM
jgi:hypothetical protein